MTANDSHLLLQGWYDYREVALSVLLAVSASYAALELAGRGATGRARARRLWLAGAITAMSSGIWGMHYTGMLAFKLPVPVAYDLRLVMLSWLPAIFGSAVALYLFTRENRGRAHAIVGGIFQGGGISGLHYTSMSSMRAAVRQLHDPTLVAVSIVIAIVFSLIGLTLAFDSPQKGGTPTAGRKIMSVLAMGAAICVMHYVAMAAVRFELSFRPADQSHAVSISPLDTFGIGLVILILQVLAVMTSSVDRRLGAQHELSARILQAQDQERRRLARHLHETVAQSLTALKMNLARINRATGSNPAIRNTSEDSMALADNAMREVRTLSYLLHPPLLEESGLASALGWYVTGFGERSGIKVTLDIPDELGRLPEQIETAAFRMVQESLTNIHRHSGSTTAKVRISARNGSLRVEVEDEGRGMAAARRNKFVGAPFNHGVGLASMRERAMQLGGRLEIESSSRGTKVSLILPLPPATLWQEHVS
jgi:signal transduction histidine kinase